MGSSVSKEELFEFIRNQVQTLSDEVAKGEGRDPEEIVAETDIRTVIDSLASLELVFEIEAEFFNDRPATKVNLKDLASITVSELVDMIYDDLQKDVEEQL